MGGLDGARDRGQGGGQNASGELYDHDSGTDRAVAPEDRSPFSGGKRVLADGLLTRAQTAAGRPLPVGRVHVAAGARADPDAARLLRPRPGWRRDFQ
jgi:hypothetical protein